MSMGKLCRFLRRQGHEPERVGYVAALESFDRIRSRVQHGLHLLLLGTPNQPPRLARRLQRLWLYRLLCGQSGQLLARPEFFAALPRPALPYTIIAGSAGVRRRWGPFGEEANDWLVAVEETKISPDDQPIVYPVGHTFMMNDSRVQRVIAQALQQAAAT
jgi:hypothetical protein